MKKILYIILIALLSVVAGLAKATPLSGSGTETAPYIIATTADWTEFCDNHATYKNSYIKMANFVTAATNKYFNDTFSGTFDGDGYTLTVNISGGRVAPFMQVSNGTIKNLRVAGSITGSANHTSGLISFCTSNTTCTIQNCIVSATITNNGNLGGFIGHGLASTTINITDCVFNGTLSYSGANNNIDKNTRPRKVGGFVSWEGDATSTYNMSRCFFDGTINCTAGFTPFIVKYANCNVSGSDAASCLYTVAKSSGFPSSYTVFDGTSAIGQTAEQIVTTMNNAGGNGWRVFKGKAEPSMQTPCTLGNIPDGWTITASGASVPVTNGDAIIAAGATVVLSPPQAEIDFVKSVTLTDAPAPSCRRITLDTVQHHFVAQDCDTLTGTLAANVKISIADGATVTLDGVTINGTNNESYRWAGITCLGNVTITLKDGTTNTVKGFYNEYPGVFVYDGYTLTIKGGGKLIASSNGHGAGIGGGYNISCGNIDIQGGIIEATGGYHAAGIGGGHVRNCGTITITDGVTRVTATKGTDAPNSIGIGYRDNENTCGTVTIGGTVYYQDNAYVGDGVTYLTQSTIVYPAPTPTETTVMWNSSFISGIDITPWAHDEGASVSQGNITATFTVNAGWRSSGIVIGNSSAYGITFSSTSGNISKIEIYGTDNSECAIPSGWTYESSKLTWQGTPAQSVTLNGVDGEPGADIHIDNISQIVFTVQQ